jgi:WD40 repeat protein
VAGVGSEVFDELKPMPRTQFKEVITGPAERATQGGHPLQLEPELVNKLLDDCTEGADTLPLLALTLARLYEDYRGDGIVDEQTAKITLADYEAMGGMRHVVQTEIDGLLATDAEQRAAQLELLRAAFIPWLATVNPDSDQAMRRVARWNDLPAESRPLLEKFVAKRLLVEDNRDGEVVVEVALESLLRQWDELAAWLADEREDLKAADNLERAAAGWDKNDRDDAWLLQGTRLVDAEALAAKPGFHDRLEATLGFLQASRQRENERIEAERQHREAELQAAKDRQEAAEKLAAAETAAKEEAQAHAVVLRKRSRVLRAVLAATTVVAIIAVLGLGLAIYSRQQARQREREATAERVAAEALSMLNRDRPGGDVRAIQETLAALALSPDTTRDDALAAAVKLSWASKVISPPGVTQTAAYSPDGHLVASGGFDHTVRLWNADTGQPDGAPLTGHTGRVTGVAFSPDGQRIASVGLDGELRLWDVAKHQAVMAPATAGGRPGSTGFWTVAYSPDGRLIATGGTDSNVRLWDAQSLQPVLPPITGHVGDVYSVAFSPNGHIVASGGADHKVRLWNAETGGVQFADLKDKGHAGPVLSVAFSPDGKRLASASSDTTIWIWDVVDDVLAAGHQLSGGVTHPGHTAAVNTIAFNSTGKGLVSGSIDGTIRVWNLESGWSMPLPSTRRGDSVQVVAFRPGGTFGFMSCSAAGGIQLSDNLRLALPTSFHDDRVTAAAFSPDGKYIASSSKDTHVQIWDIAAHQPFRDLQAAAGVGWVAYSPDGRSVASSGWDGNVYIWDAATGVLKRKIDTKTSSVGAVAYSPDGHRVVSADDDHNLQRWDPDTGAPVGAPMKGHTDSLQTVAFSPDGKLIASGGDDNTVRLWSADTGAQIGQPLTGHTNSVYSVAFSPDGRRLVSGSLDGTVREWDVSSHAQDGEPMIGHAGTVRVVAFSPDGHYIASGGEDGTVRVWDADSQIPVGAPLSADWDTVYAVAFSADGSKMVSGGNDDELHLWPFPVNPRDSLCGKITANMSPKQWTEWISPNIGYHKQCPQLPIAPND